MIHSPYIRKPASVQRVMGMVLLALVPGIVAYAAKVGAGILVNLAIATLTAIAAEALILRLRKRPVGVAVTDLSAVVTAWLVALCFPPIVPWWLTMIAVLVAIVVAKHLFGGLGQNPFNPAMVAYCSMIVAYPALMSQWPPAGGLSFETQLGLILGGARDIDGMTGATALDALRTGLRSATASVDAVMEGSAFGFLGGRGWEWISLGYVAGGALLLITRTITWHMPAAFIGTLALVSGIFWLFDPVRFASPLFHSPAVAPCSRPSSSSPTRCRAPPRARQADLRRRHRAHRLADPGLRRLPRRHRLRRAADEHLRAADRHEDAAARVRPPWPGGFAMSARYSATRTSLRTALIMLVFTVVFTALMASTYTYTRPAIEASAQDAQMRLIDEVLPPDSYDNALLEDVVRIGPTPAIGLDDGGRIWRARKAGEPVALIVETAATDGYAGRIAMVVAINTNGLLSGVRVTAHKETPGLGDYIDPKKDRRKDMPWIGQFAVATWKDVNTAGWTVRKDGGTFGYRTGATISARAVVQAVGRATAWAVERQDALFSAPLAARRSATMTPSSSAIFHKCGAEHRPRPVARPVPHPRDQHQHGQCRSLGLATILVMAMSNLAVSALRNFIPYEIRIPVFVLIIAALVTVVDLAFNAFLHDLYLVLGIFIPLIVTNCIVLARVEAYAAKNDPLTSTVDGIMMGLGLVWVLALLGGIRELLGAGTLFSGIEMIIPGLSAWNVFGDDYPGFLIAILPPGAFFALGCLIAAFNAINANLAARARRRPPPSAQAAESPTAEPAATS